MRGGGGKKGLVQGGVTVTQLQKSTVEMGEPAAWTTIPAALHQSVFYGREWVDGNHFESRYCNTTALMEFAIWHLMDSESRRKNILWSDEAKIELQTPCLAKTGSAHHLAHTIPAGRHSGGSIMLCGLIGSREAECSQI